MTPVERLEWTTENMSVGENATVQRTPATTVENAVNYAENQDSVIIAAIKELVLKYIYIVMGSCGTVLASKMSISQSGFTGPNLLQCSAAAVVWQEICLSSSSSLDTRK